MCQASPPAMSLSNSLRFGGAIPHALSEMATGFLSKLAFLAIMVVVAPAVHAQGGGTSTIAVEQSWAPGDPTGAMNGAVYMTLANKADTANRLTATSSDVPAIMRGKGVEKPKGGRCSA